MLAWFTERARETSVAWHHSPCWVELGINAQGWKKVAEADGNYSEDVESNMKHRWYPCSK
jgi:hypothetical protein